MLEPPFYVVSDTHWFHDNIVKYCDRIPAIEALLGPDRAKRLDVNYHNYYMLERWNAVVGPNDKILHLGDLFAWFKDGKRKFEEQILPKLNGDKYLILGNHDKEKPSEYERLGFKVLKPFTIMVGDRAVSFDHYPTDDPLDGITHVHGHIHNTTHRGGPRENQINVSVEVIDYTPVAITDLIC